MTLWKNPFRRLPGEADPAAASTVNHERPLYEACSAHIVQTLFCERNAMTQISRRSLFGAAAAASVLPTAGGLAAFSPIAAAAAAPKKARTIAEITAMSPVDMARESDVVQTAYEIIRTSAGRLRNPTLRKTVLDILENPAPTIASADEGAVLSALK